MWAYLEHADKAGYCPKCDCFDWEPRKAVNLAGHVTYPLICAVCSYKSAIYLPAERVKELGREPPEIRRSIDRPACEVCGAIGAEKHHWAPWSIFGDEFERWPTSFLCQRCHATWHQRMTGPRTRDSGSTKS